jgi:hypothetical protein
MNIDFAGFAPRIVPSAFVVVSLIASMPSYAVQQGTSKVVPSVQQGTSKVVPSVQQGTSKVSAGSVKATAQKECEMTVSLSGAESC